TGVRQTHTGMVSEGYSPIEQYLTNTQRSPATDIYGLASTLYALLTAQVPMPVLLRDREKMPSPRELQPHLSAAVNQAIMRGMAVEARFRPQTVEEWLDLLPGMGRKTIIQPVPTHAVPTIDLSTQDYEPPLPQEAAVTNSGVPPTLLSPDTATSNLKKPWFKKMPSPRVIIGTGVAIFGVTLGFGLTKIASTTERQQQRITPIAEQQVNEASAEIPKIEFSSSPSPSPSPSASPSASPQKTTAAKEVKKPSSRTTTRRRKVRRKIRTRAKSATNTPKRRRRSNTASSTNYRKKSSTRKSSAPSKVTTKKSTTSNKSTSNQSTRRRSKPSNQSITRTSKRNSRKNTPSSTPQKRRITTSKPKAVPSTPKKVVPSPSLVERLRKVRDSRRNASSSKNSVKLKPAKKRIQPVIVPATPKKQPKSSNLPGVVVPTQQVKTDSQAAN
ncbi:MAG: serine/threonine protein kinase, partial [Cyanobacteria bacterium J06635_10]